MLVGLLGLLVEEVGLKCVDIFLVIRVSLHLTPKPCVGRQPLSVNIATPSHSQPSPVFLL